MDLKQVVEQGVEVAFDAAKDFVVLGTYYSRGSAPDYDPENDVITYTAANAENVRILRTAVEERDIEATPVAVADWKFIIPTVDLNGIVPDETDSIEYAGVMWNVLRVKGVPGDSIQIIYVRRK